MERVLGGMERGVWRVDQAGTLNFVAVAAYRGVLDPAGLRTALARLQARHPVLRARIVPDAAGKPARWTAAAVPAIPLREEARRDDMHWAAELTAELNRPLPWRTGPLARVVHLRGATGGELLAAFHHAAADGESGVTFLRQLLALAARPDSAMEQPLPARPALEAQLPRRARGLPGWFRTAGMVLRQLPRLSGLGRLPAVVWVPPHERRTGVIPLTLDAVVTAALVARCRAEGTSVHGALAAAFLQAAAKLILAAGGRRPARIGAVSPVSLRAALDPPAGGDECGLFVSAVTVLPSLTLVTGAFWPLARAVRTELAAALRRDEPALAVRLQNLALAGNGDPERLALKAERLFPAAIGISNLGRLGDVTETFGGVTLERLHFSAALNALAGAGLGVAVTTYAGRLQLNVAHAEPLLPAARARAMADDALTRLRAAIVAE